MNFRPDIDPVEQTRDATSSAPDKVMAGDPAVSASGVDWEPTPSLLEGPPTQAHQQAAIHGNGSDLLSVSLPD